MKTENSMEMVSPPKETSKEEISAHYLIGYLKATLDLIMRYEGVKKGYTYSLALDGYDKYLEYRKQRGWDE